jgi:CubicO group peptidase (beta-lactamase class C family)
MWRAVAAVVERGIAARAFPAATIEVGRAKSVLWRQAFGTLTYAADAPVASDATVFDLASLTKVIATTTRVMQAVDAGRLTLDDRVADRLHDWRGSDREAVTIADLLEHASGLTAYLPFFRDHKGRAEFERAICTMPLEYAPRMRSIYSDLGFILLGFILEDAGFPLEGFSLRQDFRLQAEATDASRSFRLEAEELTFDPPKEWRERTAPTELDLWRGRLIQGEVHDENTWALGGIAGHAGLFGTAAGVGAFAREALRGFLGDTTFACPESFKRFARKSGVPGSSRALGWDTMLATSSCGTRLSDRALGHTGFTGTSLWIDPAQDLYVVLLTNRVHPSRDNNAIQPVRRAVHDAVIAALCGLGE